MSYENWKNKAQGFQTVDVRHIQGSFFEGLKKRAEALEVGEGLHIIQTFEPHPLYAVMEGLEMCIRDRPCPAAAPAASPGKFSARTRPPWKRRKPSR